MKGRSPGNSGRKLQKEISTFIFRKCNGPVQQSQQQIRIREQQALNASFIHQTKQNKINPTKLLKCLPCALKI